MAVPTRHLTPQGTEILIETLPHLRSVSIGFWVRRGSCHESAQEEGLAHFLEHTVFKGTASYPTPDAVAEATERLGGHVDAFTGKEVACFYGRVLAEQLPEMVKLLGDLVTTPTFDRTELERERGVILEEIAQSEDTPDDWVSELFYGAFWKGGPLAHPILGRPDQVATYGSDEAAAFFKHTYRADQLVISAAGHVTPEVLLPLLEPILARLAPGLPATLVAPNATSPFLINVNRKDLQQVNLVMGFPSVGHRHADRAAVGILSHVLGGGMASRLFMELRERRGLCYQVGSYHTPYLDSGSLQISASCAPKHARELVSRSLGECLRLREQGVTAEELERAKLQARTQLVFGQESASSRQFSLAHQTIHWGELKSLDEQVAELNAVTEADVARVAKACLDPAQIGLAALGTRRGCDIRDKDLVA